jgi:hypothetical protein
MAGRQRVESTFVAPASIISSDGSAAAAWGLVPSDAQTGGGGGGGGVTAPKAVAGPFAGVDAVARPQSGPQTRKDPAAAATPAVAAAELITISAADSAQTGNTTISSLAAVGTATSSAAAVPAARGQGAAPTSLGDVLQNVMGGVEALWFGAAGGRQSGPGPR